MSATVGVLLLFALWALGFTGSGFARAEQQNAVLEELERQRVERLEERILTLQREFCAQPINSRPRAFYLAERNRKLNEYRAVSGREYSGLPYCSEVVGE